MPVEIERKFLVTHDGWRTTARGTLYRQGYLSTDPSRSVRIRLAGDSAFITVKGIMQGASRAEYEYAIPMRDASELLEDLCLRPLIEKTRYRIKHGELVWEVDVFAGDNAGLVIAEVELFDEDQLLSLPDWVGEEVTGDVRYYNASLVARPYSGWKT